MAYTKEQRLINSMSGNTKGQRNENKEINVTGSFNLPNKSGDHVRSIKREAPVNDYDLVNKEYVDANSGGDINELDGGSANSVYDSSLTALDGGDVNGD